MEEHLRIVADYILEPKFTNKSLWLTEIDMSCIDKRAKFKLIIPTGDVDRCMENDMLRKSILVGLMCACRIHGTNRKKYLSCSDKDIKIFSSSPIKYVGEANQSFFDDGLEF